MEGFAKHKMNIRKISDKEVSLSFDETTTLADVEEISSALAEVTKKNKL